VAKPPLPLGTWQVQVEVEVAGEVLVEQTAPPGLEVKLAPMAVSAHAVELIAHAAASAAARTRASPTPRHFFPRALMSRQVV